jgi:prepilin-type N-terminal cleavage/methylation domain-containing protein/prepilin-type processing-associated H-X9-DG protein
MSARGFTMVEMLVVLAIVAVLAGIGIPVGRGFVARSREAACLNQLRNIGIGLEGYLQDHQGKLPVLEAGRLDKSDDRPVLETVLLPYVASTDAFRCPQDPEEFVRSGSSYLWNTSLNGQPVSNLSFFGIENRPDRIPMITDKESWHSGRVNFLYADQSSSNKVRFGAAKK